MGHGGGGARSAQSGAGHFPTLGFGFPSSEGAAATSFGVSGPLESPLLPAGGPSASLRYTAVSYSQGTDSSPIHLQALGSSGQEPGGGGGGRRVSTCTPTCVGHACTHTPTTHTPREQAQLSPSHRGTHPRPPAPASWKQSPPAGRWSSLATPERPSPALHPRSHGPARMAASGPLPCWNEPSALEFVEKSGVSRLLFFLARPYHKLVGKPEG